MQVIPLIRPEENAFFDAINILLTQIFSIFL